MRSGRLLESYGQNSILVLCQPGIGLTERCAAMGIGEGWELHLTFCMPKGTVHIVRNFYTTDAEGVYDMAFTPDGQEEPDPEQVIRRFYGEQELGEFLKHHLRIPEKRTDEVVRDLVREKHASIANLEFRPEELRKLKLAA